MLKFHGSVKKLGRCLAGGVVAAVLLGIVGFSVWKTGLGVASLAAAEEAATPLGKQIENFQLPDFLGAPHALADWKEKPAVVVAFVGAECPLAKLYSNRLVELAAQFEPQGVQFVAIDSNQQDSLAKLTQFAHDHKIEFPVLKDPGNKVADQFGARSHAGSFPAG